MADENKNIQTDDLEYYEKLASSIKTYVNEQVADDKTEEDEVTHSSFLRSSVLLYLDSIKEVAIITIFYILMLYHFFDLLFGVIHSISTLEHPNYSNSNWTYLLFMILPIFVWLLSTNYDTFHYRRWKWSTLYFVTMNLILHMVAFYYVIHYEFYSPGLGAIKITPIVTYQSVVSFSQFILALPTIFVLFFLCVNYFSILRQNHVKAFINEFKLKHHVDIKDRRFDYNMKVVKNIEDGKFIRINEIDRWLHKCIVGATGTGKTSSVINVAFYNDLKTREKIVKKLKKIMYRWVKKGKAIIVREFEDHEFSIEYFEPLPKYEKKFNKLKQKYRIAGVTIMGPDEGLSDDCYDIAKKFGLHVNRIDPKRDENGKLKAGFIGCNPFYIPKNLTEYQRKRAINKKAILATDIMQKIYDMGGKSDPYFKSINRVATTTLSILLMVTYPTLHKGRVPTLEDVLVLLSNPDKMSRYTSKFSELVKKDYREFELFLTVLERDFHNTKFLEHATGLRVQLSDMVSDSMVNSILCSQSSLDIDAALANGEITVCNFELGELGEVKSSAVGQFFSGLFIDAVIRQPGTQWTRLPHFWYIDEFPIIVNNQFERVFSLFRKFRVSTLVAIQTFDQMEKDDFLKYLKGIMLNSCAHHFIFGRANINDMDTYSKLAGTKTGITKQERISTGSIFEENSKISRQMVTQEEILNHLEPYQVRDKDFQELTFITTRNGRLLPPYHGKVNFLPIISKLKRPIFKIDWSSLIKNALEEQTSNTDDVMEQVIPSISSTYHSIEHLRDAKPDNQSNTDIIHNKNTETPTKDITVEASSDNEQEDKISLFVEE